MNLPVMEPRQAALARADRLTGELLELVGQLRAVLGAGRDRSAPSSRPERTEPSGPDSRRASGRLRSGDLRAALGQASHRPSRSVPHLFG